MPGLIEQIQKDALNSDVPVTSLLRRVKLAASKLKIENIASWIDHELSGYPSRDVPQYRKIQGRVFGWNPFHGWIPIVGEMPSEITIFHAREALSSIEALLANKSDNGIHHNFDDGMVRLFNDLTGLTLGKYALKFGRGHLVNAVEAVRNNILELAIELEQRGIVGDGMSFSNDEIAQAKHVSNFFNLTNNGSFAGNFGSDNTAGNITVGDVNVQKAIDLAAQIEQLLPHLASAGINEQALAGSLATIKSEAEKTKPSQGVVKAALTDIRNVLSGAAGNVIATGILAEIAKLFGP